MGVVAEGNFINTPITLFYDFSIS